MVLLSLRTRYGCHAGRLLTDFSDLYLDPDDGTLIDNAMNVILEQGLDFETHGLDCEKLQRRLQHACNRRQPAPPEQIPVPPQVCRQMIRERLNEPESIGREPDLLSIGLSAQANGVLHA